MTFRLVSIEGNIGSGKSTLLEELKKQYANNSQVIFLDEPVKEWETIRDSSGNSMLQKFYDNPAKYSFSFQMMAYISRLKILKDTIKKLPPTNELYTIITERCLMTDKQVFAKMLFDQGNMEDVFFQIYNQWFDAFVEDTPVSWFIYVKTPPEKCLERIGRRTRTGETAISMDYLKDCDQYHETFLDQTNKIVLDGRLDVVENPSVMKTWINTIASHLSTPVLSTPVLTPPSPPWF